MIGTYQEMSISRYCNSKCKWEIQLQIMDYGYQPTDHNTNFDIILSHFKGCNQSFNFDRNGEFKKLRELLKQSALKNLYKNYLIFEFSIVKLLATVFLHIIPKNYKNITDIKRNGEIIPKKTTTIVSHI